MEKDRAIDVEEIAITAAITAANTTTNTTTTAPSPPHDGDDDDDDDDNEGPYTYGDLERGLSADPHADPDLAARNVLTHIRTGTSICSAASRPPDYEVVFEPGDPEDPRNWPVWYRGWTLAVLSYSNWVVVLYSTSYTASIPGLTREFGVTTPIATLGLTTYLLGLAVGSLIVAPLSELYGRQRVYLGCMAAAVLLVIPCGLAKTLTEMIVIRFFGACFGSAFITNSPGSIVDISSEKHRALAMSLWSIAPLNGPVTGPLIGGFVFQYLGWRWSNWIVLIMAGVAMALLFTLRETYAPTLLQRKAARIRKETDDLRWWSKYDERVSKWQLLKVNMARPFILSCTEPILWFFNFWISLVYAILYLCFLAYPIVFSQHRGWSPSMTGLSFVGIGIGTLLVICSEPLIRRVINAQPRDPVTGAVLPEASGSMMALGAVLTPLGQLGFSWTGLPITIHWAVPIAFGIPFGAGNTLCFIYGSNYLASSYGLYAASALAGNAVVRSVLGGVLPLAGPAMYARMTPSGRAPFGPARGGHDSHPLVFWKHGAKIRAKSRVLVQMREEQEKAERKRERFRAMKARREAREASPGGQPPEPTLHAVQSIA
ncbi:unnamed protein product [Parascedosporium putredinis]|uniref:Major facilitator superfamily (MFS) profile domain-containing protein n=1 Tax=Parascedosporium putredinis TaxID=1442378 RepID=A0A9P1HCL5_9PEZI|nr:unnamed protein product [Parascedosporium putredinis]CAI8003975.1 unnamed protein product [Parascedosporium putredinis]